MMSFIELIKGSFVSKNTNAAEHLQRRLLASSDEIHGWTTFKLNMDTHHNNYQRTAMGQGSGSE